MQRDLNSAYRALTIMKEAETRVTSEDQSILGIATIVMTKDQYVYPMPGLMVFPTLTKEQNTQIHLGILGAMIRSLEKLCDEIEESGFREDPAGPGHVTMEPADGQQGLTEEQLQRLMQIQKEDQEGGQK